LACNQAASASSIRAAGTKLSFYRTRKSSRFGARKIGSSQRFESGRSLTTLGTFPAHNRLNKLCNRLLSKKGCERGRMGANFVSSTRQTFALQRSVAMSCIAGKAALLCVLFSLPLLPALAFAQQPRACIQKMRNRLPATPPVEFDKPQIIHKQTSYYVKVFSDTAQKPGSRFD
jgi:hypothetical protein